MFINRTLRLGIVGLLLAPYAAIFAQGLSTKDLVKGNYGTYATSLKLDALPADYSAVKIASSVGSNDGSNSFMSLIAMSVRGNTGGTDMKYKLMDCSWTNGDTVHALNKDFLVTYKLDLELSSFMRGFGQPGMDTSTQSNLPPQLKVSLVALDSIQSVTPCPEFTKDVLVKTFRNMASGDAMDTAPAMPAQGGPDQGTRISVTLSNAKQASLALMMYGNDYDDSLPYAQSTKAVQFVTFPYSKTSSIWKSLNPNGGQLVFNMGISGALMASVPDPANTVMLYDSQPWPDGRRVVGFCDGHAKIVGLAEWKQLWAKAKPTGIKRVKKPLPTNYGDSFDPDAVRGKSIQTVPATAVPPPIK